MAAIWKGKGAKNDPLNYRPISILPVLARMFERVIAKQLANYCYSNNQIPQEQFGFRASSNCEMALLAALDSWMGEVDKGSVDGALLIDLSKEFYTVPHQQLLVELAAIGCGQSTLNLFQSYLTGREQRVKQGQKITNWCKVSRVRTV